MRQKFIPKELVISMLNELDEELEQLEKDLNASIQQLKAEWFLEQEELVEQCHKRLDMVVHDNEEEGNEKTTHPNQSLQIQYGTTI